MNIVPFVTVGIFFVIIALWFIEELFFWPYSIWSYIKLWFKK